jgi:hypothetical protein
MCLSTSPPTGRREGEKGWMGGLPGRQIHQGLTCPLSPPSPSSGESRLSPEDTASPAALIPDADFLGFFTTSVCLEASLALPHH